MKITRSTSLAQIMSNIVDFFTSNFTSFVKKFFFTQETQCVENACYFWQFLAHY